MSGKLLSLDKSFLALLVLIGCLSGMVHAESELAGTSGAAFLKIDQSVKAASMGGAFEALADDPSAVFFNPAGLLFSSYGRLAFTQTNWIAGSNLSTLCYSHPVSGQDAFGISASYLNYGSIQETTSDYRTGTGRNFSPDSVLAVFSWAKKMRFGLVGLNAKVMRQNIDSYIENGVGFDLGLLSATPINYLRAGVSLLNIGWSGYDSLPLTFLFGLAYEANDKIVVLADMRIPRDGLSTLHFGAEYALVPMLILRGGVNTRSVEGAGGNYSAGLGLNISNLNVDYAYVPYAELGDTHRLGLVLRF